MTFATACSLGLLILQMVPQFAEHPDAIVESEVYSKSKEKPKWDELIFHRSTSPNDDMPLIPPSLPFFSSALSQRAVTATRDRDRWRVIPTSA
jgi:hypothetical protein